MKDFYEGTGREGHLPYRSFQPRLERAFHDLPWCSHRQEEYYRLAPCPDDLVHYVDPVKGTCSVAQVLCLDEQGRPTLTVPTTDYGAGVVAYLTDSPDKPGVLQHEAVAPGEWVQREMDRKYQSGTWHWPCDRVNPKP